jgi:hypothetical protein
MKNSWGTLTIEGDAEVQSIIDGLKNKEINLDKAFKRLYAIETNPENFKNSVGLEPEITKEVANAIFDFIENETDFDIEKAVDSYHKYFSNY